MNSWVWKSELPRHFQRNSPTSNLRRNKYRLVLVTSPIFTAMHSKGSRGTLNLRCNYEDFGLEFLSFGFPIYKFQMKMYKIWNWICCVLWVCETWSLFVREENGGLFQIFGNRVLKRIFGHKRLEIKGSPHFNWVTKLGPWVRRDIYMCGDEKCL